MDTIYNIWQTAINLGAVQILTLFIQVLTIILIIKLFHMKIMSREYFYRYNPLIIGIIISIFMLGMFFYCEEKRMAILKLDTKWLVVSAVPILLALLISGYIKSFKGFGVEIDANLHKPVYLSKVIQTMSELPALDKEGFEKIKFYPGKNIARLSFTQGRTGYYNSEIIYSYIEHFYSSLKYFEIKNSEEKFIALLPLNNLFNNIEEVRNNGLIDEFIKIVECDNLVGFDNLNFCGILSFITKSIRQDNSLVNSLSIMRKNNIHEMAVVDEHKKLLGVLTESSIEKQVVTDLLIATGKS